MELVSARFQDGQNLCMTMTLQQMASLGGKARAKKLTKAQRHDAAMRAGMANAAKWKGKKRKKK